MIIGEISEAQAVVWAAGITAAAGAVAAIVSAVFGYLGRRETRRVGARLHDDHEGVHGMLTQVAEHVGEIRAEVVHAREIARANGQKLDSHLDHHATNESSWDGSERRAHERDKTSSPQWPARPD